MPEQADPPLRPTRAIVDLDRIISNFRAIRSHCAPSRVFPVVKANAYGHGAPAVARALERAGADALCVALVEEGYDLRRRTVASPILLISSLDAGQIGPAYDAGLTPTLYRTDLLEVAEAAGRRMGRPAGFHVTVDTGMSRLGLPLPELAAFIERLRAASPHARLEGVYSSLACADRPQDPHNARQIELFEDALRAFTAAGISPGIRHLANSACLENLPGTLYDAVRPGILLYGVPPLPGGTRIPVRPALSLVSEIVQVREAPAGTPVGYSSTFITSRHSILATIPAGYDDGVNRHLSNKGVALVNGRRAPILGRVSMDLTVLDVTDCGPVGCGDEVVLIGAQGDEMITAWDVSSIAGSIPWDILCRIGGRVTRDFHEGGRFAGRWSHWQSRIGAPLAEEGIPLVRESC
jgi:alanine racemase